MMMKAGYPVPYFNFYIWKFNSKFLKTCEKP